MSDSYTRRHFIQAAGAGLAALAGARRRFSATAAAQGAIDPRDADLVVLNAKELTMDPALPTVEAYAVTDVRMIAVGSAADISPLVGRNTERIDAEQMTIVPGVIDLHKPAPGTR